MPTICRMARPVGVSVSMASVSDWESYALRFQIIQQDVKVTRRPAQPVKLPDRQHVTSLEGLKAFFQRWPLGVCTRGLIGEYLAAPCPLQSRQLQVRVSVFRGDPRIPYFHSLFCP